MPDIEMRFNLDMLALSSPADATMAKLGIDVERDREYTALIEPEIIADEVRLEAICGVVCFVTNTRGMTDARLAHSNLSGRGGDMARTALALTAEFKPQHVLVEIGPTGLPLDVSSASSLKQNRDQYRRAVDSLADMTFDGLFFSGFSSADDLQCALMGARMVYDGPILTTLTLSQPLTDDSREAFLGAQALAIESGADCVGVRSGLPLEDVCAAVSVLRSASQRPVVVELDVDHVDTRQMQPTPNNPYYRSDCMVDAAAALRHNGAQFIRAVGAADAAYAGAINATISGSSVVDAESFDR